MEEKRNNKVYKHTNKINGKIYVGITNQKTNRRWRNNGKGYMPKNDKQSHFWNAIQKYGWDNFEHEILHDNLTDEEANNLEKYYVKKWDLMNPNKGYNKKEGGKNPKPSEETRKKLSESHKGYKVKEETKEKLSNIMKDRVGNKNPMYGKGKKVIYLETKEIFDSCRIAGDKLNISSSCISAVCRGVRKSCKNMHFCYLADYDPNKKYEFYQNKRKIECVTTGEIFNSINEARKKLKINNGHISEVCQGKLKSINGFVFKYIDNN